MKPQIVHIRPKNQIIGDFKKRIKKKDPFVQHRENDPTVNWIASLFGFLIGILSLVFGIYLTNFKCGNKYITLCIFGVIVSCTLLVRFVISGKIKCIQNIYGLRVVYGFCALLIIISGFVTIYFLKFISDQTYCKNFYCHSQVPFEDYLNFIRNQKGEETMNSVCDKLTQKYPFNYNNMIQQSLLSGLKQYFYQQINPSQDQNFDNNLIYYDSGAVRIVVIIISSFEFLYAILLIIHSWILKMNKYEQFNNKTNQKSKVSPENEVENISNDLFDEILRNKRFGKGSSIKKQKSGEFNINDGQGKKENIKDEDENGQQISSFRLNETEAPLQLKKSNIRELSSIQQQDPTNITHVHKRNNGLQFDNYDETITLGNGQKEPIQFDTDENNLSFGNLNDLQSKNNNIHGNIQEEDNYNSNKEPEEVFIP